MVRHARHVWLLLLAWLLVTPPYGGFPWEASLSIGCADPGHSDLCAPLTSWIQLGAFETEAACTKARDDRAAAAYGKDDEKWAALEQARCFTDQRIHRGPRLLPGE